MDVLRRQPGGSRVSAPARDATAGGADTRLTEMGLIARVAAALPPAPVQAVATRGLHLFPTTYGLPRGGARDRAVRAAYHEAFPDADVDSFVRAWSRSRARGMAFALTFLARQSKGPGGAIAACDDAPLSGPAVIAFLHTSIDPVPVMALLESGPLEQYRWVMWPAHRGPETAQRWKDERDFMLRLGSTSAALDAILLDVSTPNWLPEAVRHLRRGGRILIAADAPFDGDRGSDLSVTVGGARLPLTSTMETLARLGGGGLYLLVPDRPQPGTRRIDLRPVGAGDELAQGIGEWIASQPLEWAGWPFITDRRQLHKIRNGTSASI
jgi:hypothetical protein